MTFSRHLSHPRGRDPQDGRAQQLRWQIGGDFHEGWMEAIYADAARHRRPRRHPPGVPPRPDLDRTIDRIVTSRAGAFR
jgi:hypothetical protein